MARIQMASDARQVPVMWWWNFRKRAARCAGTGPTFNADASDGGGRYEELGAGGHTRVSPPPLMEPGRSGAFRAGHRPRPRVTRLAGGGRPGWHPRPPHRRQVRPGADALGRALAGTLWRRRGRPGLAAPWQAMAIHGSRHRQNDRAACSWRNVSAGPAAGREILRRHCAVDGGIVFAGPGRAARRSAGPGVPGIRAWLGAGRAGASGRRARGPESAHPSGAVGQGGPARGRALGAAVRQGAAGPGQVVQATAGAERTPPPQALAAGTGSGNRPLDSWPRPPHRR